MTIEAEYADVVLEDHFNMLIMVANTKVQWGVINCRREISIRPLVNGAWKFWSTTNLTKKSTRQTV